MTQFKAQPKFSSPSKMPCFTWSTRALETCPAAWVSKAEGTTVPACELCYARGGFYNMPNVKEARIHNESDWMQDDWIQAMVSFLDTQRYFRWFDSGDLYKLELANKVLQVMELTPWVNHWIPTRMHKFAPFRAVLERMAALPNVVVRYSSDGIHGETIEGKTTSTIVQYAEDATPGMSVCPAYTRDGKCGDCRTCWNKEVSIVAYPAHGQRVKKGYKIHSIKAA